MAVELSQFHDAFFEEAYESLDAMEAALLQLDVGSPDADTVNTVFRVAHSIKGGAGMFGFTEIASFTHTLETLLDELRGNRMQVTSHILDLLLKSVYVLRGMLKAVQKKTPIDQQGVADLQFDLELLVAQKGAAPAAPALAAPTAAAPEPAAVAPEASAAAERPAGRRWRIDLRPGAGLLARGNDPLRMLAELHELGDVTVTSDFGSLPALADLDPEHCHMTWSLELVSEVDREVIEQVFEWAEGDCELSISELKAGGTAQPDAAAAQAPHGAGH